MDGIPSERLGDGQYGSVVLGMRIRDQGQKPESRRLCAIKVQEMVAKGDRLKEAVALKCLVHDNIIDYFHHFIVHDESDQSAPVYTSPQQEAMSDRYHGARTSPKSRQRTVSDPIDIPGRHRDDSTNVSAFPVLWIMMEFADAGNLVTEMSRYPENCIPESGVLYYSKQVLDGLKYMHGREIAHGDLHLKNILLKYRADRSKKCLISNFSSCRLIPEREGSTDYEDDIHSFVKRIVYMLSCGTQDAHHMHDWQLMKFDRSGQAMELLHIVKGRTDCPRTVDDLLKLDWFKTESRAPRPRPVPAIRKSREGRETVAKNLPMIPSVSKPSTTVKSRSEQLFDKKKQERQANPRLIPRTTWDCMGIHQVIPHAIAEVDEPDDLPHHEHFTAARSSITASLPGELPPQPIPILHPVADQEEIQPVRQPSSGRRMVRRLGNVVRAVRSIPSFFYRRRRE